MNTNIENKLEFDSTRTQAVLNTTADRLQAIANKAIKHPISSILSLCLLAGMAATIISYSQVRTDSMVTSEVNQWLQGHPVMSGKSVAKVQTYPNATTPGAVSVVSLAPQGTVVVNRDTRLPFVVMFTPDHVLQQNLADFDEPVKQSAARLAALEPNQQFVGEETAIASDVYVPAMLTTKWHQFAPFNNQMPVKPDGTTAVTGCGTIALAQILNYHQWPPLGEGTFTFADTVGEFKPTLTANFSQPYQWNLMKNVYAPTETGTAANAIARVVQNIATLGINCELNSSGNNLITTGNGLANHLFFDKQPLVVGNTACRRTIEQELLKGLPVPAVIVIDQTNTYHHIVAFDGLLVHNGQTSYHTNFGWYETYNVWWDKDALRQVLQVIPTKPSLVPIPAVKTATTKVGEPANLSWNIPANRQVEATQLNLFQKVRKNGTWEEDCEFLPVNTDTLAWSADTNGFTGNAWKVNSPYPGPHYLNVDDVFIAGANTTIGFQTRWVCGDNYADIEVSVDGNSFQPIFTLGNGVRSIWETKSIPLGQFAGKKLKLRIAYQIKSHYYDNKNGGGIWIDNLRVHNTLVDLWEPVGSIVKAGLQGLETGTTITTNHPELKTWPAGSYTLAATLTDNTGAKHRMGSEFTVNIAETVFTSFSEWTTANAVGQTASQDHDRDGVPNGVEYFMGKTGNNFSINPTIVSGTVTWPKSAAYAGTFQVQTSPDLKTWTDVTRDPAQVTINPSSVVWMRTTGNGNRFVRLVVTPD